jgi:hypothetical protein
MIRLRRYLLTYFTWKTLSNHICEDLRKPKAPNRADKGGGGDAWPGGFEREKKQQPLLNSIFKFGTRDLLDFSSDQDACASSCPVSINSSQPASTQNCSALSILFMQLVLLCLYNINKINNGVVDDSRVCQVK